MLSLLLKPYGGMMVGDWHGSGKDKDTLQLSKRMEVSNNFGAKHLGGSAVTLLYR